MFLSVSGGQRLDRRSEIIPQLFAVHLEAGQVLLSGLWRMATLKTRSPWGQIEKRKGDKISWRCSCLTSCCR
ncbi:hypothetical protein AOLI_G00187570 [Acnodon oligacanthus]